MMKTISIIGLVTAITGAIALQVSAINPKAGLWVMLAGTVASAAGGALRKFAGSSVAVTAIGLIVAVCGALAMATDVIPAKVAAIIAIVGTAASAAGQSLFGWPAQDNPVIGSNIRGGGHMSILLLFGLIGFATLTTACGEDQIGKAEEGIRKIYVGLQGASDVVDEIYRFRLRKLENTRLEGSITSEEFQAKTDEAARNALAGQEAIKQVAMGVRLFKERVRMLPEITKDNKVQLLPLLDALISDIDRARQAGLIGVSRERVTEVEAIYTLLRGGVATLQGVIAAIKKPVPTNQVPALVQ